MSSSATKRKSCLPSIRLDARGHRLRQRYRNCGLVTGEDFRAAPLVRDIDLDPAAERRHDLPGKFQATSKPAVHLSIEGRSRT